MTPLEHTPIVVTGCGAVVLDAQTPACDPLPHLAVPKTRKFMGLQDDMAVVATGAALEMANLAPADLGERAGLYVAVGNIPFERTNIDKLVTRSTVDGAISMAAFATRGLRAVHPLLTFRCLPNMPAFHISSNFNIQGSYFVTYPGSGQLYMAIEQAIIALGEGSVDVALVGGVAHQRNFLVENLYARVPHPIDPEALVDAAGVLVLERAEAAAARGAAPLARLASLEVAYSLHDPFGPASPPTSVVTGADAPEHEAGAAAVPVLVSEALGTGLRATLRHAMTTRDGIVASSRWERCDG